MPRKKTQQEFETQVAKVNPDIDLSNFVYINSRTKGLARCKKCGNEWMVVANSLMLGIGCRKCFDKRNSESRKQTFDEVQQRIAESGSNAIIIGEYIDTKHTCLAKCKYCGYEWHPHSAMDLILGHGCPKCANQLSGLWREYTTEQMLEKIREKYKDSEFIFEHKEGHKFNVTCPIHGVFVRNYDKLMLHNVTTNVARKPMTSVMGGIATPFLIFSSNFDDFLKLYYIYICDVTIVTSTTRTTP